MTSQRNLTSVDPFTVQLDLQQGVMLEATRHTVRRTSELRGYYTDERALERLIAEQHDPVHYEVFEIPVPEEVGHLMYCISKLQPGCIGDECFMTKGHYHTQLATAEIYLCVRGVGLMLMKTQDGQCQWQAFSPGRMVYVPPCWAHRSINTGIEPLISYCVYPAQAGHNYGDIQTNGFPRRVYLRQGQVVVE